MLGLRDDPQREDVTCTIVKRLGGVTGCNHTTDSTLFRKHNHGLDNEE